MKVVAKKYFPSNGFSFEENKVYDAKFTPIIYDPNTFQPIEGGIIVQVGNFPSEPPKWIKSNIKNFYTLEEARELKLKNILE